MRNIVSICLVVAFIALSGFAFTAETSFAAMGNQSLLNSNKVTTLNNVATTAGVETSTPLTTIVGNIIKIMLTLLGIIVLILIIYAGFLWMTAGGNPEQVDKAKQWLTNAIIGLAIILAAYAISGFVIDNLFAATGTT